MEELGRPNTRRTPLSARDSSASLLNKSFNPGLVVIVYLGGNLLMINLYKYD